MEERARLAARAYSGEGKCPCLIAGDYAGRIQALMGAAGVVPFSGSLLAGALGPAATLADGDREGNVVAAAHGYLPHNAYSDYHQYAWGGLVAVVESQRGKGLGNFINARMIVSVFRDLDATHIYEFRLRDKYPLPQDGGVPRTSS